MTRAVGSRSRVRPVRAAVGAMLAAVVAGALCATPASAAPVQATRVAMDLTLNDVVAGIDAPIAVITVSPAVSLLVEVQAAIPSPAGLSWLRQGVVVQTGADGVARVPISTPQLGAAQLRAAALQAGAADLVSATRELRVHPATPAVVAGTLDPAGPMLLSMQYALCTAIAEAVTALAPISGPEYAAAVAFAGGAYQAAVCDRKSFSASLWAGFTTALQTYVVGKPFDVGAEKVWGPSLDLIMKQVRLDAAGLGPPAKNFLNDRILILLRTEGDAYATCLRNVGMELGWPARVLQCSLRDRAARASLTASQL